MSVVSRWTQALSRFGRDSLDLSRAVYAGLGGKTSHQTASERLKAILLHEARRDSSPNRVARSLLHAEKELGLVRYWGLAEYLRRQKLPSLSLASIASSAPTTNPSGSHEDSRGISGSGSSRPITTSSTPTSAGTTGARVAFMITSSMKRDLVDGLGYSFDAVKGMTPQQASLVLHHRLAPSSYEKELPGLEEAFLVQQQQQTQQQAQQQREEEPATLEVWVEEHKPSSEAATRTVPITESSSSDESLASTDAGRSHPESRSSISTGESSSESGSDVPLMLSSSSPPSNNHDVMPSSESSSPSTAEETSSLPPLDDHATEDLWYEVVEVQKDEGGSETEVYRHGLYKDREEALLGLETRQEIQRKRHQQSVERKADKGHTHDDSATTAFVLRPVAINDL